ncbi:MAG: phosphoenolpyruvate synthase PpsA [Desulfosarcina sp.]|nr:phosphoenolpyruvate synthase PpsA [Desulfobacterales bacterium]
MNPTPNQVDDRSEVFDLSFKVFHELMARKVNQILLVSSPYEAYIMEEEGRLAQRIIQEYRGLNLSRPPHLTWVSSAREALLELDHKSFDMVITMPRLGDMPAHRLGRRIKGHHTELPVFLLTPNPNWMALDPLCFDKRYIDRVFIWSGNANLLLAIIKSVEDSLNVAYDTRRARVRVIIMVEDSPFYISSLLPLLYKEIVGQTQAVMEESLNEEHRFFRMRARPKILMADTYEDALALYRQFRPYLLGILSDVRFPREGRMDPDAGFRLLQTIKAESPDIPLLNFSSEESNRGRAQQIPAVFLNKNAPVLHEEIRCFFQKHLGFGDFVFHLPDGHEVGRAANLRQLEAVLPEIPEVSIHYHALRNHFSGWLMARSEILLAYRLRPVKVSDFESTTKLRDYLVACLKERRRGRQRGVVTDFDPGHFDPDADFVKIGNGSMGGKARGLAFMASQLKAATKATDAYPGIRIGVPKTLVISTEAFDAFIDDNGLRDIASCEKSDDHIQRVFQKGRLPVFLQEAIDLFLNHAGYPLAVRSSSLLEDAQHQPFTGLYETYLLPNCHPDRIVRRRQFEWAIKQVYASTFRAKVRRYARSTGYRIEQEKMAVLVQKLTGSETQGFFCPDISGQAFSFNFYPVAPMKAEDGIALMVAGLGAPDEDQIRALRFSPHHPQKLPQFSTVDDILQNAQRHFEALNLQSARRLVDTETGGLVKKLDIDDWPDHPLIKALSSTFMPAENRIRDSAPARDGYPVLTFAPILKHNTFPLPAIIIDLLKAGSQGMGGPVEIEFAVQLPHNRDDEAFFHLLKIRPMPQFEQQSGGDLAEATKAEALCFSRLALGNGRYTDIADIVLVDPDRFDPARTVEIAAEISRLNAELRRAKRRYLLIGPGRWGSADHWLGIPVTWNDISQVAAIIETGHPRIQADPSQGSHFFQNLTSLGIVYLTLQDADHGHIRWAWFERQPSLARTAFLRHIRLSDPLTIQVDGRSSEAVVLEKAEPARERP